MPYSILESFHPPFHFCLKSIQRTKRYLRFSLPYVRFSDLLSRLKVGSNPAQFVPPHTNNSNDEGTLSRPSILKAGAVFLWLNFSSCCRRVFLFLTTFLAPPLLTLFFFQLRWANLNGHFWPFCFSLNLFLFELHRRTKPSEKPLSSTFSVTDFYIPKNPFH